MSLDQGFVRKTYPVKIICLICYFSLLVFVINPFRGLYRFHRLLQSVCTIFESKPQLPANSVLACFIPRLRFLPPDSRSPFLSTLLPWHEVQVQSLLDSANLPDVAADPSTQGQRAIWLGRCAIGWHLLCLHSTVRIPDDRDLAWIALF